MTSSTTHFLTTIYCVVILLWNITQIHGECRSSVPIVSAGCRYEIANDKLTKENADQYCRNKGWLLMPANNDAGHLNNFNSFFDNITGAGLCEAAWTSLSYNAATDVVDFANGDTLPTSSWDTVSTSDASAECLVAERGTGSVPGLVASDCSEKLNFICIRLESPCSSSSCESNQRCVPQYSTHCTHFCEDVPSTTTDVLPSTDSSTDTTSNGTNSPTTATDSLPTTTPLYEPEPDKTTTPLYEPEPDETTTPMYEPEPDETTTPLYEPEADEPTAPPGLEWWQILLIAIGCVGAVCLGVYVVHKHCRTTPAQSVSAKFKNVV